ncbi:fumarylacetoacetate hydrolase [Chthonomonas calidirosea]|uniref:Fumarylacetoacetate hydrolase n=1 Tax=Chthonomonas calidirosea (strain DSM 23976 / ICMP 18418 / T49) TaxID=1303518 RepID=S0EWW8_CHTCT|nr:fumarylacetoacetate hydrolase family protein [Chthonomonas calidirosea]CCW36415.1 fumarylacetoacetate hydrolase [Chthonomonas calidirosea T49]CEK17404.1 fumarylacetoacetate hydrolase [Chthonomonas calidirosea]
MKLLRLKSEPRFYYILIGEEIFDFAVTVPGDLRLTMPLDANEFLPIICQMRKRGNLLERHQKRLEKIGPEELRPFRRPFPPEDLDLPVHPTSFRDFYAFEAHVRNARRNRGLDMIPEWYEAPAFYFSNTACMLPHGAAVPKPVETEELDFELEVAAVIGMAGCNIPVEEADDYIAGFTILNDWSARDIQRREMKVGLGPAKSKDFATSLGPYLVTPDELEPRVLPESGRGRRYDLTMKAFVNGQQISHGNLKEMHWTFAELIAHASRNTTLLPGDLIGSGTVGTGSLVEFPSGTYPWLRPGDVVRLEVDLLGTLENQVV